MGAVVDVPVEGDGVRPCSFLSLRSEYRPESEPFIGNSSSFFSFVCESDPCSQAAWRGGGSPGAVPGNARTPPAFV